MGRRKKEIAAPEKEIAPDLDSIDWGEEKLTKREKLFCFWYAHPETGGNAALAARKAGYTRGTAKNAGHSLLQRGKIKRAVALLEGTVKKEAIACAYNKIIQKHINRATVDRTSFYRFETVANDNGTERLKVTPKMPEELTESQKDLIESVEYSGNYGLPNYKLYPAEKSEKEIVRMFERMHGLDRQDAGFDAETVVDVVSLKEGLRVKARLMQRNSEIAALAGLRDSSSDARAEED